MCVFNNPSRESRPEAAGRKFAHKEAACVEVWAKTAASYPLITSFKLAQVADVDVDAAKIATMFIILDVSRGERYVYLMKILLYLTSYLCSK